LLGGPPAGEVPGGVDRLDDAQRQYVLSGLSRVGVLLSGLADRSTPGLNGPEWA
jgi:hypothetical protein